MPTRPAEALERERGSQPDRPGSAAPRRLIVLANRAPISHRRTPDGRAVAARSASGLVTALEPLLALHSGTWVAHGSGDADRLVAGRGDGLNVCSATARYRLRYVWLSGQEHGGYYSGFANEGLWPLCHDLDVAPVFRRGDFDAYQAVNRKFVAAAAEESCGSNPVVLVQDYHFALAPRLLRQRLPESTVVAFWHIPWPGPQVFRACPWSRQLLDGLLGSHMVGFQTDEDCVRFLQCAEEGLDADVSFPDRTIVHRGRVTRVRAYPVGVEWEADVVRTTPAAEICRARLFEELGLASDVRLGVGVDRLDYSKGIPQKFLAIERLLENSPELRGKFVFLQIAEPSRDSLPSYQEARRQVVHTRDRVNSRFRQDGVEPIRLLEAHHDADAVYRCYRAADLCYVGSLRDGMNLVAKEFVSARGDGRGVLVLSARAGAAQQLHDALLVDPYETGAVAGALDRALAMTEREQAARMRRLRAVVRSSSAQWWADQLLADVRDDFAVSRTSAAAAIPVDVQIPA